MRSVYILLLLIVQVSNGFTQSADMKHKKQKIAIAIHGGAANIKNLNLSEAQQIAYSEGLAQALDSGYQILQHGGRAVDAVVAAIKVLEDNPLFNAGKGSVFTADSINEMDAAIMDGYSLKSGAVTCVRTIKNPIEAAQKVLDSSAFVFLSGVGAEKFAQKNNCVIVAPDYFKTEYRWQQFKRIKNQDTIHLDNDTKGEISPLDDYQSEKFGTVGCVAIDETGNLASGTSTGGLLNKKYNRIGDSPIIGAGTYANNQTCAVSCTGKGEDFIRLVVAYDISALMEYKGYSLNHAVNSVIQKKLIKQKGRGGCIAIDKRGNISMSFTTSGMFRGSINKHGEKTIMIF